MSSSSEWSRSERIRAWIRANTEGVAGVVDLGCGQMAHHEFVAAPYVGVDLVKPRKPPEGTTFCKGDMRDLRTWKRASRGCDTIMFMDSLEHLDKEEAIKLVLKLQQRFGKILAFVPTGDHKQDFGEGDPQTHRALWEPEDLQDMGFVVDYEPDFHLHDDPSKSTGAMFAVWPKPAPVQPEVRKRVFTDPAPPSAAMVDPLVDLDREMREKAAKLGHAVVSYRDHVTSREFRCGHCGLTGGIALVPPPGAPNVSGPVLESRCQG